jgi:hypothetical protein
MSDKQRTCERRVRKSAEKKGSKGVRCFGEIEKDSWLNVPILPPSPLFFVSVHSKEL